MKIILVVGTRPNFIKVAPIIRAIEKHGNMDYKLIHTGQHYDNNMSDTFFENLNIPKSCVNFGVGLMSHINQTTKIMTLFESYCLDEKPDVVLVIGDVNSTLACALVASQLKNTKLVHVEAGERSFDRKMPEEINRVVTDVLSDYLFCTTEKACNNLLNEGCDENKMYLVGNVAIDTLLYSLSKVPFRNNDKQYILCTIHRQSNTDDKNNLEGILKAIDYISNDIEVRFPIHPRTRDRIKLFGFDKYLKHVQVLKPLDYLDFLYNMKYASLVLTDSGGIQVETTVLDVPCVTVRENTEWQFTITEGTNTLVEINKDKIIKKSTEILKGNRKYKNLDDNNLELLDGHAAYRVVEVLSYINLER